MQKFGSILSRRYKPFTKIMGIRSKWADIAGELLASHTEPVQIKDKTLFILCDSPAWVQQIGILSSVLLPRIKEQAGVRIDKVEGKFGRLERREQKEKQPQKLGTLNIDPDEVQKIENPELRRAIEHVIKVQGGQDG